jgi:type I restriction enzyme S subunit
VTRIETIASGRIDQQRVGFAEGLTASEVARYRLQGGDILFSHINSEPQIGRTAVYVGVPSLLLHGMNLLMLRPAPGVEPFFLHFLLSHLRDTGTMLALAGRAVGQSSINQGRLRSLQIRIPELEEQQRISALLSAVQRAIERQERLIALTAELKKALMHKLFTEGTRGELLKQTEIGAVPETWTESRLGTVARFSSGGTPSREVSEYWTGGTIPWVKTTEINYETITETEERITEAGLNNSSAKIFPVGTLVMAMYGQGVTRGRVGILGIAAATNQASAAIMPHSEEEVSTVFLYHFLEFHYEYLRQRGHGANQTNLSLTLLKQFPVYYPKHREQLGIVAVLRAVDEKRAIHERERIVLIALFRNLLHQLMTAQIRVHDLDPSVLDEAQPSGAT